MRSALCLIPVTLLAQGPLQSPLLVSFLDRDGRLTAVQGLPGTLLRSDPGVAMDGFAYSGNMRWSLSGGMLTASRRDSELRWPADAGSALFSADTVYFTASRKMLRYAGSALEPVEPTCEPEGELLGIKGTRFLTRAEGELRICGEPVAESEAGPALLHGSALVYWNRRELHVKGPDGAESSLPFPAPPLTLTGAAPGWAYARTANKEWLLKLESGKPMLFVLPRRIPR